MKDDKKMPLELAEHAHAEILHALKRPLPPSQTLRIWGDCQENEWLVGLELVCSERDVYYKQEVGFQEEESEDEAGLLGQDSAADPENWFPLLLDASSAFFLRFHDEEWLNPLPIEWREMGPGRFGLC